MATLAGEGVGDYKGRRALPQARKPEFLAVALQVHDAVVHSGNLIFSRAVIDVDINMIADVHPHHATRQIEAVGAGGIHRQAQAHAIAHGRPPHGLHRRPRRHAAIAGLAAVFAAAQHALGARIGAYGIE